MTNLSKGEIYGWKEDSRQKRLMWLWLFALAVFGVALSGVVAPVIISYLVLSGIAYSAAFLIAALAAIALIIAVMRFFSLNAFYSDFLKIAWKDRKNWLDGWYLFANVAGLGLGIALCVYVGPAIINALMLIGASHAFAVFISIIAGLMLLKLTTSLFLLPNLIKVALEKTKELFNNGWLAMFILASRATGVAVGIYLAVLVFPLITAALTSAVVPQGLAILTALVVSIGLVGACHSLLSKSAFLLADFMSIFYKIDKGQPLGDETSKLSAEASPVAADTFLAKAVRAEMPREYEDGAAFSEEVILPLCTDSEAPKAQI